jgi:pimeloyl-ACP methyl ester carboxylesterase
MFPLVTEMKAWDPLGATRLPTPVIHHTDDPLIPPEWGKYVAGRMPEAKYLELPDRNVYSFVELWESFQKIAERSMRRLQPFRGTIDTFGGRRVG